MAEKKRRGTTSTVTGDYCPQGFADFETPEKRLVEGAWRIVDSGHQEPMGEFCTASKRATTEAYDVREAFMRYFVSPQGSLPFQLDRVRSGMY